MRRINAIGSRRPALVHASPIFGLLIVALAMWLIQSNDAWLAIATLLLALLIISCTRALHIAIRRAQQDIEDELVTSVGALWGLSALVTSEGKVLPRLGGFGLNPSVAHVLIELFVHHRLETVVELGSGSSTILIPILSRQLPYRVRLFSLENESDYLEVVRAWTTYHSLEDCELIPAPLEPVKLDDWQGDWYSQFALDQLPDSIDLLLVDGPANIKQTDARYPALPLLAERMREGALIFVDDTNRRDESRMIERWHVSGGVNILRRYSTCTILQVTSPAASGQRGG